MNYIEFEIGGKLRGFKLGLGFIGDILQHYDTDMMGLGKLLVNNPFSATPTILFLGHKHDSIRKGLPFDVKMFEVEDWVEEIEDGLQNKNIEALMVLLLESVKRHLPQIKEVVKTTSKKK